MLNGKVSPQALNPLLEQLYDLKIQEGYRAQTRDGAAFNYLAVKRRGNKLKLTLGMHCGPVVECCKITWELDDTNPTHTREGLYTTDRYLKRGGKILRRTMSDMDISTIMGYVRQSVENRVKTK